MDEPPRPDDHAPTSGRSRIGIAMLVVSLVLVLAAAVMLVVGMQADSAASDDRARARHLHAREQALEGEQRRVDDAALDLEVKASTARLELGSAENALVSFADAQHHFVDAYNRGAALRNQGDQAGADALFTNETAAGVAEMDQKNAALQQQVQKAEAAVRALEEALG